MRPLALLLLPTLAFAEASSRDGNLDAPPSTPEQQRAMFHLPPGFEIQLVAAEPAIQKPMNLNFDAAGRLWVTGSEMYPWPAKVDALGQPIAVFDETWKTMSGAFDATKAPPPPGRATDTVRVLSDFAPDGRARKIDVFADALNIPIGIQPLPRRPGAKGDSAIVFSIPKIWRLTDTDGDGRADLREPLYGDFGFRDTHGMSSNYLYWIDGWIYGCHGFANHSVVRDGAGRTTEMNSGNTYRFRPDGSRFEIYTHGQTNPFGLAVDDWGNFYSADSHSRPVMLLLPGAHYAGIGKTHDGLGFAPTIMDHDHGSSAIAGLAWYGADHFPPEFRGNTFNGNPVTRRINRDRYEWQGSTPRAIEMPDFLTCDDPWFRPVQVKLGPDGALWIADFYTPIIGHYEQPLADPRRDHAHGRIWRIVWRGEKADAPAPVLPDLAKLDAKALIEKLGDANITTRSLATNELVERVGKEASSPLSSVIVVSNEEEVMKKESGSVPFRWSSPPSQRVPALWAAQRLGILDDIESRAIARSFYDSPEVRAHTVQIVREHKLEGWAMDCDAELLRGDPRVGRVAAAIAGSDQVSSLDFKHLLNRWDVTDPADTIFVQAIRMRLRSLLASPTGCVEAARRLDIDAARIGYEQTASKNAEKLAAVSLAVPSTDSASFLLAHLQHTKFATPRAGEYLRHAVLNLPEEKLGDVSALLQSLADAPLADAPLAQRLALADGLGQAARERGWKLPDDIAAWTQRTLLAALDDNALADRAIAALRDATWSEKFAPLQQIVLDPKRDGTRRAAALEAALNLDRGVALASQALADPTSLPLRKKAAELLGRQVGTAVPSGPRDGASPASDGRLGTAIPTRAALDPRAALLAALPTAPAELALAITASLAKTDPDFTALLELLEAGKASPAPLRNRLIAILVTRRADALRARADALTRDLPPEDARLDGVIAARVKAFASAKPDAARGEQVFAQQCAVCHRFRDQGGNVGPNLDGVVARGPHRIIEDILDPNRNVDPTFRQATLELTDGRTLVGVNFREEGNAVLLTDAAGQTQSAPKPSVKSQTQSSLSLMPPAYETAIPADDFNALLAYLVGQ